MDVGVEQPADLAVADIDVRPPVVAANKPVVLHVTVQATGQPYDSEITCRFDGNPSLSEGRTIAGRAVMGGLSQRATLVYGPGAKIEAEARAAVKDTGGRGLLLAPGCSVSPRVREANLAAMMSAVAA